MRTILLLTCSNVFMTFAWYGHLKHREYPLWIAIMASWLIALVRHLCLRLPGGGTALDPFIMCRNYAVSFLFLMGAVAAVFWKA